MALSIRVKDYEFIHIGPDIRISLCRYSKTETQVWIEAPGELKILREKHFKLQGTEDVEPAGAD